MALPRATTSPRLASSNDSRPTIKIPPDWLHEPRFAKRSDLLDARQNELKQIALAKTRAAPYFELNFARSETLVHDTFRKNGVDDVLNKAALSDPTTFHPRAVASGSPTRSVLLDRRTTDKRLASLTFEPPEIMRLRDIPKPGALELQHWWTKGDGYVEDPSTMITNSLRLQLSPHRHVPGPMDPAKVRSPASVDERRRLRNAKAQLADKITHISHAPSSDDVVDVGAGVLLRASDLYAQQRRYGGSGEGSRSELPVMTVVSPIKPSKLRSPKRSHRHVENLFLESTNQRMLLDQLKAASPMSPSSCPSPLPPSSNRTGATAAASPVLGMRSSSSFASTIDPGHAVKGYGSTIRCGGFA